MLIGAALARPIGSCEVRLTAQCLRDPFVISEFAAVVKGDRMDALGDVAHGFDDGVSHGDFRAMFDGATDQLARFTFDHRDQRALMKRVC